MACMALNILVGHTGLVSFGHGAWFGLAAYAAAIMQREHFAGHFLLPMAIGVGCVLVLAWVFGFLILRRRGVYFSLLTLALSAMLYVGRVSLDRGHRRRERAGRHRAPELGGFSFENTIGLLRAWWPRSASRRCALWRFHRSPVGSVLVAIRENEQRARFLGYPTNRYKLVAFVASAGLTGLAGILLLFQNRMTSADPISVSFSGDLLAMVVIGGMRSFLGPALGALFFVIFRDNLSRVTENWLLYFGLLFVAFIVFSPTGLVGLYERATRRWRPKPVTDAAMSARQAGEAELPAFLKPTAHTEDAILVASGLEQELRRHPRGPWRRSSGARPHAARADRPQRRRQDDGVQPDLRHVPPRRGHHRAGRRTHRGPLPGARHARGHRPLVPDHQPFRHAHRAGERAPRGPGARSAPLLVLDRRARHRERERRDRRGDAHHGTRGHGARRGRRRSPMAASACSTWAWRSPPRRACCCWTSRSRASPPPSASASAP